VVTGTMEFGMTFHILGMSSSQLTNSYFSEGWLNHQPEPFGTGKNGKKQIHRWRMFIESLGY
jgi:hypothetical protein